MNVEKIMTSNPQTCRIGQDLGAAATVMWQEDCGFVPVIGDGGELTGVVTDRDLCMAALTKGTSLQQLALAEPPSVSIAAVRLSDDLSVAHEMMRANQVRRLPVLDDEGQVCGVVSLNDLVRDVADRLDTPQGKSEAAELVRTMAAICEPRKQRW